MPVTWNTSFEATPAGSDQILDGDNKIRELKNAAREQIVGGGVTFNSAIGSTNNYTMTLDISPSAYNDGQRFYFIPNHINTGAATLNVNALGASAITRATFALTTGDLISAIPTWVERTGNSFALMHHGLFGDGTASAVAIGFGRDTNLGFYRATADNMVAVAAGVTVLNLKADGSNLKPLQPMVTAYSAGGTDITGDGTVYTITFGTEDFDNGGNFASPTFTCPQTGVYVVDAHAGVFGAGAGHTVIVLNAVATVATYRLDYLEHDLNGIYNQLGGSAYIKCTAGDTITITLTGSGSTKTIDLDGGRPTRVSIALLG